MLDFFAIVFLFLSDLSFLKECRLIPYVFALKMNGKKTNKQTKTHKWMQRGILIFHRRL